MIQSSMKMCVKIVNNHLIYSLGFDCNVYIIVFKQHFVFHVCWLLFKCNFSYFFLLLTIVIPVLVLCEKLAWDYKSSLKQLKDPKIDNDYLIICENELVFCISLEYVLQHWSWKSNIGNKLRVRVHNNLYGDILLWIGGYIVVHGILICFSKNM